MTESGRHETFTPSIFASGGHCCRAAGTHWIGAETFDPSLDLRIGKACSDIAVELVDDGGGGAPGRTDPDPTARLVSLQKFRDRWHVG